MKSKIQKRITPPRGQPAVVSQQNTENTTLLNKRPHPSDDKMENEAYKR